MINSDAEILRLRRRNLLQGQEELVIMGDGRGTAASNLYDGAQRIWVRWPGEKGENGNDTIGLPFSVLAGFVNYPVEINMQVYIRWYRDGRGYMISSPDPLHIAATGRSMTRLNRLLPENNFITPKQWQVALPVPVGGLMIAVQAWIFVLDDGNYIEYPGSSAAASALYQHIDMTPYLPSTADYHRYGVLIFNVNEYLLGNDPLQVVTSTAKAITTDLTPADIAEAIATRADASCRPLWAFRLEHGQTVIRGHRFDRDLRSMPGGPLTIPDGFIVNDMIADGTITEDKLAFTPSAGVTGINSPGATLTITNPTGPTVSIDVAAGQFAPADAKYIVQQSDADLPNAQAMSALGTGIVKNTTGTGVQSIATAGTDYTTPAGTENLSNKTITSSSLVATALSLLLGGFRAIFSHANTADRTYTFPDVDGTVTLNAATQNISNKTITASSLIATALSLLIGGFRAIFTHANTADRTYSLPDATTTLVGTDVAQTLSFKTLLTPIIASFVNATHDHSNAAGGGNLTGTAFGAQAANSGLFGPITGAASSPTFRAMVTADIGSKIVTLAKEADGTAYKFRGWDSSGVAAEMDGMIVSAATFTDAVSVRDAVYRNGSNWTPTRNYIPSMFSLQMSGKLGIVVAVSGLSGYVVERGPVAGFSGLTPGGRVYVGSANGTITQSKPSTGSASSTDLLVVADVGYALTSSIVMVDPKPPTYTIRTYLAAGSSVTIEHHADALEYTRKCSAVLKTRVNALAQSYASSNQDADIALNALNLTATLTVDSAGATASGGIGNVAGVYRRNAQTFQVATTGYADQITISFAASTGAPAGTVTWTIETTISNLPSGTLVSAGATGTFTPTASATNTITIPIANAPLLVAGTLYAFTMRPTSTLSSGNNWNVNVNNANPYGSGIYYIDTGTGPTTWNGTWNLITTDRDMRMTVRTRQSYERISQSWSHGSAISVSYMRLWMKKVGSPTGNLTVQLFTTNGSGNPNIPTAIVSAAVSAASLSTSYGWITFYFPTPFAYTSGTMSAVLITTDAASQTNYVVVGGDTSAPGYANGDTRTLTNSTWSATPVADAIFELYEVTSTYTEAASVGAISQANTTLGVRFDDGSGANSDTKTTFQNLTTGGLDVVCMVEVA